MKTSDDAFDADIDLDEEETLEEEGLEGEELTQSDWEDDEADGEARADASEEDLGEAEEPRAPVVHRARKKDAGNGYGALVRLGRSRGWVDDRGNQRPPPRRSPPYGRAPAGSDRRARALRHSGL